jgi:hypothetical protein
MRSGPHDDEIIKQSPFNGVAQTHPDDPSRASPTMETDRASESCDDQNSEATAKVKQLNKPDWPRTRLHN